MANTVDKVISIALNEVGYLEKSVEAYKKDPSVVYKKTEGAGYDNYTKYNKEMHELNPRVFDYPCYWCASFVSWVFYKAFGFETAQKIAAMDDYTVAGCQIYQQRKRLYSDPEIGDQVFFTRDGKPSGCHHTGLVIDVTATSFTTVEGNTSSASGVVRNGGGVAKKTYLKSSYKGKVLFGRPDYDTEKTKYILNGGSFPVGYESQKNPVPLRDGYAFAGWYKDKNLKKKAEGTEKELYAKWVSAYKYKDYKTTQDAYLRPSPSTRGKILYKDVNKKIIDRCSADENGYALFLSGKAFSLTQSETDDQENIWGKMATGYYLPLVYNGKVRIK